jgi:hypothetical protein
MTSTTTTTLLTLVALLCLALRLCLLATCSRSSTPLLRGGCTCRPPPSSTTIVLDLMALDYKLCAYTNSATAELGGTQSLAAALGFAYYREHNNLAEDAPIDIDKALQFISENRPAVKEMVDALDYHIIDEISMVPEDEARLTEAVLSQNPNVIVVAVGDFHQLPPVVKGATPLKYAFETEHWPGYAVHILQEYVRGEPEQQQRLERVRDCRLGSLVRAVCLGQGCGPGAGAAREWLGALGR